MLPVMEAVEARYQTGAELPPGAFQYIVYENSLTLTPAETLYYQTVHRVRKRITASVYYVDITLTSTGFDGDENIDWTWLLKYTGQTAEYRSGVRGGNFVVDSEISSSGFAGSEDTDWEELTSASGGGVQTTYRDGIRNRTYVIDKTLTATGFAGLENTDWENVRKYKPI